MRSQALWCCWVLLAVSSAAHAQDEASLRAWIEREAAVRIEDYADRHLRWEWGVQYHETWTDGELATLRATVAEYPDHPAREKLERIEAIVANRGSAYRYWQQGDDWRLSQSLTNWPSPTSAWFDRALSGKKGWVLFPTQLRLLARDSLPASANISAQLPGIKAELLALVTGGLDDLRGAAIEDFRAAASSDGWLASGAATRDDRRGSFSLEARWLKEFKTWSLNRLECEWTREGTSWRRVCQSTGPRWNDAIGRVVYDRVIDSSSETFTRQYKLAGVVAESMDFAALVADPTESGVDLVRGPSRFTSVDDLRNDPGASSEGPDRATDRVRSPADTPRGLVWSGWVIAGFIVIALVTIRIRRA